MKKAKKLKRKLAGRIADWEATMQRSGDIVRKHPKGFRKPGSNQ